MNILVLLHSAGQILPWIWQPIQTIYVPLDRIKVPQRAEWITTNDKEYHRYLNINYLRSMDMVRILVTQFTSQAPWARAEITKFTANSWTIHKLPSSVEHRTFQFIHCLLPSKLLYPLVYVQILFIILLFRIISQKYKNIA